MKMKKARLFNEEEQWRLAKAVAARMAQCNG